MLHHRLSYPQFVYPLSPFVKPFQACTHWKQVSSFYCVTHKMLSQYAAYGVTYISRLGHSSVADEIFDMGRINESRQSPAIATI